MRWFVALVLVVVVFLFSVSPIFSENSSEQIVIYRLKEGKTREIRNHFSPSEKIYADFTFLPEEKEMGVEFRWINPVNKKEQAYFELVQSSMPPKKKTVLCWLLLQPSLPEKIIGSRFFGRWRLEIWVNRRLVAEKIFDVGS
jgi:hypothetical protein